MRRNNKNKIIAGIDEVGRGPLAGPLMIGLAVGKWDIETERLLDGIRDSKKISPLKRNQWVEKIRSSGLISVETTIILPSVVDKRGLSWCLMEGVRRVLSRVDFDIDKVYLDGGLIAPENYCQETIIKGDDIIPLISVASIFAKVRRDNLMAKKDALYPGYNFSQNKGYGTSYHFDSIDRLGICSYHRKTFLKKSQNCFGDDDDVDDRSNNQER